MKREFWYCPDCPQNSTRHWNMKVHIQRKHGGIDQPVRERNWSEQYNTTGPANHYACFTCNNTRNKTFSNNSPPCESDKILAFTDKLVELKRLLDKHYSKNNLAQILELCCRVYLGSGDSTLIHTCLNFGRKCAHLMDSLAMLGQGPYSQSISRILTSAFAEAIYASNKHYSPPDSKQTNYIESGYEYLNTQCSIHKQGLNPNTSIYDEKALNPVFSTDPFYQYFGQTKDEFESDFQTWIRKNPIDLSAIFS